MKRAPRLLPPRVAAAPAGSRFESPFAERTRRRGRASRACAPATRREEKEKWTLMFLPLRPRRELASVLAPTQRRVPLREMNRAPAACGGAAQRDHAVRRARRRIFFNPPQQASSADALRVRGRAARQHEGLSNRPTRPRDRGTGVPGEPAAGRRYERLNSPLGTRCVRGGPLHTAGTPSGSDLKRWCLVFRPPNASHPTRDCLRHRRSPHFFSPHSPSLCAGRSEAV